MWPRGPRGRGAPTKEVKLRPDVLLSPDALAQFKRGFLEMAELAAITYGPRGGVVGNLPDLHREPELLTDAATITRRIIQMPGRARDMGAMLARHFIWRVRQEVGDGSALSAVLAESMLREAIHLSTEGVNVQMMRRGIDRAIAAASEHLIKIAKPLSGEADCVALATSILGDPALGKVVGEVIDLVGPDGAITIEEYVGPYLEREYVEGARLDWGMTSPYFETDETRHETVLEQPYVFVTSNKLSHPQDILPVLELVRQAGGKSLFVVADQTQADALATLAVNNQKGDIRCCSVKVEALGEQRVPSMEDIAILTNARIFLADQGLKASDARIEDLGRARRIVVRAKETIIVGGAGSSAAIRARIRSIRDRLRELKPSDDKYKPLRERIGHLSTGVAIIKIGSFSAKERKEKREQIENALLVLSASTELGMVPGGGAAYLSCLPVLKRLKAEGDELLGIRAVMYALEAPMRRLAASGGQHPPVVLDAARRRGNGFGYDVVADKIVDMRAAGISDPVKVLVKALEAAGSAVTMALTTSALVLHSSPSTEMEP